MSFLFVFLFAGVAWFRPVLGYGLFVLLQTPLCNVMGRFAHPLLGHVVLILATIKLLVSKPQRRLRGIEICALALSLVVLARQPELLSFSLSPNFLVRLLCSIFLWGPLLMAFNRLDEDEMAGLRLWISAAAIVVGVWGCLIYLTGSEYLIRTAIWADLDTSEGIASLVSGNAERMVRERFIVMGLFTVVPSAYWYVLRSALAQTRQYWLWNVLMYAGIGTILIAVGISGTRSLTLQLGMGTVVMLVALVLIRRASFYSRSRIFVIGALGVCLLAVAARRIDFTVVIERFEKRFSTLAWDDLTLVTRLDNTAKAWAYIQQNLCLFGAPGPNPLASAQTSVDSAVILHVWLWYGVPGAVLFTALFFTAFGRLFKCWLARRLSPEQQLLRGMLTAWALIYVYVWVVGYSMHPPEVFFTVLFFSEIGRLKDKCLTTANSQLKRTAA